MAIILNIAPCSWGKCNFCSYNKMNKFTTPTKAELQKLLEEEYTKAIKEERYMKIFNGGSWFHTEVPQWIKDDVYDFLIAKDYKWLRVENRVDMVNWDEVKSLKDRGFKLTISWGMETADDNQLKAINKGVTFEQILQSITKSKQLGCNNLLYILAGFPNSTFDDYKNTIDKLSKYEHLIDEICVLTYIPMKDSVWYNGLWKVNNFRVISKDQWKQCREYIRSKLTKVSLGFETYHWRYLNGKTYNELYKRKK